MAARTGAACRIEQQRKELPGKVSAVDVGVQRIAVAAVCPPVAGLAQRIKNTPSPAASPAYSTIVVIANHVENVGALLWLNWLGRWDGHQHFIQLGGRILLRTACSPRRPSCWYQLQPARAGGMTTGRG